METPHTKMTGYQHPGFEDEADSNDSADQRIVLDAKNANEMNRGYVCRCLGCAESRLCNTNPLMDCAQRVDHTVHQRRLPQEDKQRNSQKNAGRL